MPSNSRAMKDLRGQRSGIRSDDRQTSPYAAEVESLKQAALAMMVEGFNAASGAFSERHLDWRDFWDMYFGTFMVQGAAEGPFGDLYMAKVAPAVDRGKAACMAACFGPDPSAHDWFQAIPQQVTDAEYPPERIAKFAQAQTAAIRHSLMQSDFVDVVALGLTDLYVTGNMFFLEAYEEKTTTRVQRSRNPLYEMPEEMLAIAEGGPYRKRGDAILRYDERNDHWVVVPKVLKVLDKIKEFEAPRSLYLNPFNVYPAEMDRNGLEGCSGVYVYDACDMADLVSDMVVVDEYGIRSGNYANLPFSSDGDIELSSLVREQQVSEVRNSEDTHGMRQMTHTMVRRTSRQSYYGQFELGDLCERAKVMMRSGGVGAFLAEFNADPDRVRHMKTWLMESLGQDEPERVVRFQPNPYDFDSHPVTQHRLIAKPNETMGYGIYDRSELPERIHNYFLRSALTAAQRLSDPPIVIHEDMMDPAWLQLMGGVAEIPPGMIIKAAKGIQAMQNDIIRPVKMPSEALEFSRQAAADTAFMIQDQTLVPSVVAGQVPNSGETASGIKIAAGGAQELFMSIALSVSRTLARLLRKKGQLFAQFCDEAKTVVVLNDQGEPTEVEVPPEAWDREMLWFATGPQSAGNSENGMTFMKEFGKLLADSGRLNYEEFAKRFARPLGIVNPAALIGAPPAADPPPMRLAESLTGDILNLPPAIAAKIFNCVLPEANRLTDADVALWNEALAMKMAAEAGLPAPLTQPQPQPPPPPPPQVMNDEQVEQAAFLQGAPA